MNIWQILCNDYPEGYVLKESGDLKHVAIRLGALCLGTGFLLGILPHIASASVFQSIWVAIGIYFLWRNRQISGFDHRNIQ